MNKIYLDYAAATPMRDEVLEAMRPYFKDKFYNPSATYLSGRDVRGDLGGLRHRAAVQLGAKPAEIIFTSGASEANNLAIKGIADAHPGAKILVSSIEHDSVLKPALTLGAKQIPVSPTGEVDQARLAELIDDQTVLVSIMLVNNELGTIARLSEIAQFIESVRHSRRGQGNSLPLYLHTDAAQAGSYFDLKVGRLGVDLMSINGGKIQGPKGAGLLYVKAGTIIKPLSLGGGQEFGLRSGTENMPSIAGLVCALELAQTEKIEQSGRLMGLREDLEAKLKQAFPNAVINGGKHRAPHIISLSIPGSDNETLMMQLDEAGIQVATGSACSASSDEPSHTLAALGLSDEIARSTIRLSLGAQTTQADLDTFLEVLTQLSSQV